MNERPKRIRGYTEEETRLLVALCCFPKGFSVWRPVWQCLVFVACVLLLFHYMGW